MAQINITDLPPKYQAQALQQLQARLAVEGQQGPQMFQIPAPQLLDQKGRDGLLLQAVLVLGKDFP